MGFGLLLSTVVPAQGEPLDAETKSVEERVPKVVRFNQHVRPILSDNCFFCHGPDKAKREGDLRLDIRAEAVAAKAIVPGVPADSEMITRIYLPHDEEGLMPPSESHKELSAIEKATLKKWVASGATYETHWAYAAIVRDKTKTIDAWVGERLEAEGLGFSEPADARTLTRRLYLDLTGLPPSPDDLPLATTAALTPADVEALVDRLLDSPRYGERMASWWLDAVRYANTIGYHGDIPMPSSPFRDYVIRAFNDNLSFDQFTIEQLAGDLLPDATLDQHIAASYCRLNQMSHEGGIQDKEYVKKYQSERVRTTATAWLGATLMCAECHDHKFDPYTQEDFYSFAAFFADILEKGAYTQVGTYNDDIEKYKAEDIIFEKLPMSLKLVPAETTGAIRILPTDEQRERLVAAVDAKEREAVLKDVRGIMATISSKPREVKMLNRGDWMDDTGKVVYPATPRFLPSPLSSTPEDRRTRLDLAKWIVSSENPMTARVFANRLWAMFFQTGVSRVINDFGMQGEWPEHPELLDRLAAEFIESGWDVKHLVKTIVLSRTYQQSSVGSAELQHRDPQNRLLARQMPRRLDAEFIRDAALASSGLLNDSMYGLPVFPYQPAAHWKHLRFPDRTYRASTGEDQYRRSVYAHWQRTFLHPTFRTFDAPNRDECAMSRQQSNTPLQALALMNDPIFVEAARALADAVSLLSGSDAEKIRHASLQVLSREPTEIEVKLLAELLTRERARIADAPDTPLALQGVGQYKVGTDKAIADAGGLADGRAQAKTWRYTVSKPPPDWMTPAFNDAAWASGQSGFGAAPNRGRVVRTKWQTKEIWLRRTVELDRLPVSRIMTIAYDEDPTVYLNGEKIFAATGYTVAYTQQTLPAEALKHFKIGKNVIAVQCKQTLGGQYIDVGFDDRRVSAALREATAFTAVTRALYNLHESITRY